MISRMKKIFKITLLSCALVAIIISSAYYATWMPIIILMSFIFFCITISLIIWLESRRTRDVIIVEDTKFTERMNNEDFH